MDTWIPEKEREGQSEGLLNRNIGRADYRLGGGDGELHLEPRMNTDKHG